MKLDEVLNIQLRKVRPSDEKISMLKDVTLRFIDSLKGLSLNAHLGGSLAKGTLTQKSGLDDIDIFVVFDTEVEILTLEKKLGNGLGFGKLKLVHGSRDYFQIEGDEYILEVIPVVKSLDPKDSLNVTDNSLKHVEYVTSKIKENPALADEIRLAKSFVRANKVYGAESYIHGFSGYSLEILVIHFGSFVKFIKGISKVSFVDSLKQFHGERVALREINSSKLEGPLVVIDPTYKYRNVTAGLRKEAFDRFLAAAAEFLKNPSEESFDLKELDLNNLKEFANENSARLLQIKMSTDRQEGDIAGTKMKKFFDFLVSEMNRKEQKVLNVEFDYKGSGKGSTGYIIVLEKPGIEIRGPPVTNEEGSKKFRDVHGDCYEVNGVLHVKENVDVLDIVKISFEKVGVEMGVFGKPV